MLAATVRVTRDIDLAEECVQDAYARALSAWATGGVPAKPGAWLTTVARRRALDLMRRQSTHDRFLPQLVGAEWTAGPGDEDAPDVPDDRLRLIFTCSHPALAMEAQVALTLRLVCGLSTSEVARAFLVTESAMAARITRAKKKIALAGIPYRVPSGDELPARTQSVLTVVHLLFTTGHTAPSGPDLSRPDLVERSTDLARILTRLMPGDAEVTGLLALILLTDARRPARVSPDGRLVLLEDQDRSRWDGDAIREGLALVPEALAGHPTDQPTDHPTGHPAGPFALMAAIAAVHAQTPSWDATDWGEIVSLYDLLLTVWPSPVVALNRAVAVGMADGPEAALVALDYLAAEPALATYSYLAAARADFLRRLGRRQEARLAYEEALVFSDNAVEREFLLSRLGEVVDR